MRDNKCQVVNIDQAQDWPGAGLKTIGERGDDASDDASNWKNIRVM